MVFEHDFSKYPELRDNQLEELRWVSPHKQIESDFRAVVVKVHDGDTITVRTDFRDFDFPVRLAGIDAPELGQGGEEAREWLKQRLLHEPVEVKVNPQNRVGKYGRIIGSILLHGLDVGQEELHRGLVKPFDARKEGGIPESSFYFRSKQWF